MKPKIGITAGCPCGIGPEIVLKAVNDPAVKEICVPVIFGETNPKKLLEYKKDPSVCGSKSMESVDLAVKSVMTKEVDAIVTAPINKSHWKAAGSPFLGHTEYLANVTGTKSYAMMLASKRLRVILVTTHTPVAKIAGEISIEKISEKIKLTDAYLSMMNENRKIAVCSLNPHAGDKGAIGDEDETIVRPAVIKLKKEGMNVEGPFSADSVFIKALNGEFGAVIGIYHDQVLPVIKTLDFGKTVNVTLGLPFVRTSPDHGTAEDIVGKGIADPSSMIEAVTMAVEIFKRSKEQKI